jgi:hypothetical protein
MRIIAATVLLASASGHAWTMRGGTAFDAELAAADGLRATFTRPGKPPAVIPLADLAATDVETIRNWRKDWRRPLIVPSRIAPWPARAMAPPGDARLIGEKDGIFTHRSPNFLISSDLRLPQSAINDIAKVLEGTRAALIAIPLGLHAGGETEPYRVELFRDAGGYTHGGGANGSGGHYDGRTGRMLVLLPNLGITGNEEKLVLDYSKNLFVLKHEVTHQLMDRWHGRMPMWLSEGIAEFIASLPYAHGTYTLRNPGAGMRDYLLKWRKNASDNRITLVAPDRLMEMKRDDWESAVSQQSAYDPYNSAALLTYHFIRKDNGTPIAGYLDALRRGIRSDEAERTHLLDGKTRESLMRELVPLCTQLGITPGSGLAD